MDKPELSIAEQSKLAGGWQAGSRQALLLGNYEAVANFYEELVEADPENIEHYWYLGLAYLLLRDEEKAQLTWFISLSGLTDAGQAPDSLITALHQEGDRQESLDNHEMAWVIRGHLRGFDPDNIDNLLRLFCLDIKLGNLTPDKFGEWNIVDVLNRESPKFSEELLLNTLEIILDFPMFDSVDFAKAALKLTNASAQCELKILEAASKFCYDKGFAYYGIDLAKACLEYYPQKLTLLKEMFWFCIHGGDYDLALTTAKTFVDHSRTIGEKIFGIFYQLRAYLIKSDWDSIIEIKADYIELLTEFSQQSKIDESSLPESSITLFSQLLLYLQDNPKENRYFANRTGQLFQQASLSDAAYEVAPYKNLLVKDRPLKIGYISFSFHNHSVGWLCRWLLKHHDREKFPTYLYSMNLRQDDFLKCWFKTNVTKFRNMGRSVKNTVQKIQEDEIDILIDLDSLTFNLTCRVMSLKPAPVQATWLGNDASGIPAIDYFIADPYVLPDDAQSYYSEKIWRLPHTYLGIDGFEFSIPTLRREDLDIPNDAVIYMNFQGASKRHPGTIRLQYQILKAVPNSYFLIKGTGDAKITQSFHQQLALEEGFPIERIRFLERDKTESEHRANLQWLADVVLDTYPYNGATTTLEVLWSEIPMVTKVGEQFAARNSYTFMINAGITEGIAWTDEEYIEWGIKLGTDENLRKEISWKLKQAKKTSPLWNGKQFARDMEAAYRQMWEIYVKDHSD